MITTRTRFDERNQSTRLKNMIASDFNILLATATHFNDVGDLSRKKAILRTIRGFNEYVQCFTIPPAEFVKHAPNLGIKSHCKLTTITRYNAASEC